MASTAGEHPNVAIVKCAFLALRKADASEISTAFVDDAELTVAGRNPIAGVYSGRDGIVEYAAKRLERSGGTLKSIIHDIVASDRHTLVIERVMAQRLDRTLDMRIISLLHIFNGFVETGVQMCADQYTVDEFWA